MSRTSRYALLTLVYTVSMASFAFLALLGPTLVVVAPVFGFAFAGLISGTHRWIDDREKAALRSARRVAAGAAVRPMQGVLQAG